MEEVAIEVEIIDVFNFKPDTRYSLLFRQLTGRTDHLLLHVDANDLALGHSLYEANGDFSLATSCVE